MEMNPRHFMTWLQEQEDRFAARRSELEQYENLRAHFRALTIAILGRGYYNEGADVYECDKRTCEDIWRAFLKERDKPWYIKLLRR